MLLGHSYPSHPPGCSTRSCRLPGFHLLIEIFNFSLPEIICAWKANLSLLEKRRAALKRWQFEVLTLAPRFQAGLPGITRNHQESHWSPPGLLVLVKHC